jgi:hypothetical protein
MRALRVIVAALGLVGSAAVVAGLTDVQVASAAPALLKCRTMRTTGGFGSPTLLGGCNRPGTTGGSGTVVLGPQLPPIMYHFMYSTGKQTVQGDVFSFFPSTDRCPDAMTEFDTTGIVTAVSGSYMKHYLGKALTFDVCFSSFGVIVELVPGTFFTIS